MYHYESSNSKQFYKSASKHKNTIPMSYSGPIQLKKLKDCTFEEVMIHQPLLWSHEKFLEFLEYFKNVEIGDPIYSDVIPSLIKKYSTPQVVSGTERSSNFQDSIELPSHFLKSPMSTTNMLFYANDLMHLQLGFKSIAVLKRRDRDHPYNIVKILNYSTLKGKDDTYSALKAYETATKDHLETAVKRNDKFGAELFTYLLLNLPGEVSSIPIASVVTPQVSSCTFAAMTDRNELYAVVMHLDLGTPTDAYRIRDILLQAGVQDVKLENLFISRIEGDEEAAKEREIVEILGMREFGAPIRHQTRLNRGDESDYAGNQHRLIGIDFSSETAMIHGSQGDWILPSSTGFNPLIQTGSQNAVMNLVIAMQDNTYDSFSKSTEYPPFSAQIMLSIHKLIDEKLYKKICKLDKTTAYTCLCKAKPELLDLFSIYNIRFFSMALNSENPL